MLYALQEPATGKLTEADLDASIEPWHLPHAIRQCEMERKQHDAAATPADGAHVVTDYCVDDGLPPNMTDAERALLLMIGIASVSVIAAAALWVWRAFA